MYLSSTTLLIMTAIIFSGLTISIVYLLIILRREHFQRLQLSTREELLIREMTALDGTCNRLRAERTELFAENRDLASRIATLETAITESEKQSEMHLALLASTREQLEKDFQILAERIFTEKSTTLSTKHQTELHTLLNPVREQLAEFKRKVEDVYDRESRDRISLVKEIENLKKLNLQISDDAISLTNALKGQSKMQGLWGEMILEQLLENSGLVRGREFDTQVCLRDTQGKTRLPDVIVHLPNSRQIIIDAKVSLTAYEKACRADEEKEEKSYMQNHLDSLKKHITGLAAKEYHLLEGLNSLDFVILFLPTDGAFQAGVTQDPGLLTWALEKKIILASPSTLLAILRTVSHMWRQEEQTRNSLAIAKHAGNLYDKFIGFVEAFEEIGTRLHQTRDAWDMARKRLATGKGNLISRAEILRELGVQNTKSLPQSIRSEQVENCSIPNDDRN
ncbi:MAG: DNA recombination protein RmuC [Desulfobulbales bacterium]